MCNFPSWGSLVPTVLLLGLLSLLNKLPVLDGTIGFSDAGLHFGNTSKLLITYLLVLGAPLADGLLLYSISSFSCAGISGHLGMTDSMGLRVSTLAPTMPPIPPLSVSPSYPTYEFPLCLYSPCTLKSFWSFCTFRSFALLSETTY